MDLLKRTENNKICMENHKTDAIFLAAVYITYTQSTVKRFFYKTQIKSSDNWLQTHNTNYSVAGESTFDCCAIFYCSENRAKGGEASFSYCNL